MPWSPAFPIRSNISINVTIPIEVKAEKSHACSTRARLGLQAKLLVTIVALLALQCAANPADELTVTLDSRSTRDYAKGVCLHAAEFFKIQHSRISEVGCAAVPACPETKPIFEACIIDPTIGEKDFEDGLTTQFLNDPKCNGIQLIKFEDPNSVQDTAVSNASFKLIIEYTPGAQNQPWSLQTKEKQTFLKGDGNLQQIATSVCSILNAKKRN